MYSHKVFRPIDKNTSLAAAQVRAKDRIDLIDEEYSKLIKLLDDWTLDKKSI